MKLLRPNPTIAGRTHAQLQCIHTQQVAPSQGTDPQGSQLMTGILVLALLTHLLLLQEVGHHHVGLAEAAEAAGAGIVQAARAQEGLHTQAQRVQLWEAALPGQQGVHGSWAAVAANGDVAADQRGSGVTSLHLDVDLKTRWQAELSGT